MKKKNRILIIIIFLLIIGINRVNAGEYNGRLYEVWHPDSGFTVFAEESNGYMDYNSWIIKSTIDDKIYYCIDPATPLVGSYAGSHKIYTDKEEIISKTDFTLEKYKKVQLLAYYGYGYKDKNIDHTNKKWYGITQVMIWRIMRPDLSWTFKANRNAVPDKKLYANEVAEMNKLVDDYYTLPSFAGKNIIVDAGESITIEDTNKVFDKYTVRQVSNNVKLTQNGNKLTAYSEFSSPYQISYEIIPKTNEKFGALVSSDFQDLIRMGAPEKQSFKFILEVCEGFINIQKKDKETNDVKAQGDASLEGAIYEIYDSNNNFVKKVTTDRNGLIKTGLPYGSYTLREIKAPVGYKISNKIYDFTLSGLYNNITLDVNDEVIKGKIKIVKTKGGADEDFSFEKDACFDIYDKDNRVVHSLKTDNKGEASLVLPYGIYTLKQTCGLDGYVFSDDIIINVDEEKTYELNIKDIKKSVLEFSKADYSLDIPVPNTLIEIYKENDTLIYSGRTDKDGKIIIPNLDIGKYYILEKDASKYYRLNSDKMDFEVRENGKIVKAKMKDYRKEGSLEILKRGEGTDKVLEGAMFDIYFMETNKVMFKGITNRDGKIKIDNLIAGKYCVIETSAPAGYMISKNKQCFEIDEDGKHVKLIFKNNKQHISVPKTNAFNIIGFIASILIISGSSYFIYEKFN